MDERVTLRGTWKFGSYGGPLLFTGGPRDDYLELRADEQRWPGPFKDTALSLPGYLSLKSFADGHGLGILRLHIGGDPPYGEPAEARMQRLTELLADSVLPDLQWENGYLLLATVPMLERHPSPPLVPEESASTWEGALEAPNEIGGAQEDLIVACQVIHPPVLKQFTQRGGRCGVGEARGEGFP